MARAAEVGPAPATSARTALSAQEGGRGLVGLGAWGAGAPRGWGSILVELWPGWSVLRGVRWGAWGQVVAIWEVSGIEPVCAGEPGVAVGDAQLSRLVESRHGAELGMTSRAPWARNWRPALKRIGDVSSHVRHQPRAGLPEIGECRSWQGDDRQRHGAVWCRQDDVGGVHGIPPVLGQGLGSGNEWARYSRPENYGARGIAMPSSSSAVSALPEFRTPSNGAIPGGVIAGSA
jgi:hypothetical protein